MSISTAPGLLEVPGGWLVPYPAPRARESTTTVVLVDRDGEQRHVIETVGSLAVVSKGGRSFVTQQRIHDRRRGDATVLRQVRISDGALIGSHRIAHHRLDDPASVTVLRATARRVLVERSMPVDAPRQGRTRSTTMWWTPATGKVTVAWQLDET